MTAAPLEPVWDRLSTGRRAVGKTAGQQVLQEFGEGWLKCLDGGRENGRGPPGSSQQHPPGRQYWIKPRSGESRWLPPPQLTRLELTEPVAEATNRERANGPLGWTSTITPKRSFARDSVTGRRGGAVLVGEAVQVYSRSQRRWLPGRAESSAPVPRPPMPGLSLLYIPMRQCGHVTH